MEILTVKETRGAYTIHHNDRPVARVNSLKADNSILCYAESEEAEKQAGILMDGGGLDGYVYYSIPNFEWWWEVAPYKSNREKVEVIEILYDISKLNRL